MNIDEFNAQADRDALEDWDRIWEIVGPELLANNLPASVAQIKAERDELRQHLRDLRAAIDYEETGSQKLIERNKELHVQLNLCVEALEDIASSGAEAGWCIDRATETLDQLRKLES